MRQTASVISKPSGEQCFVQFPCSRSTLTFNKVARFISNFNEQRNVRNSATYFKLGCSSRTTLRSTLCTQRALLSSHFSLDCISTQTTTPLYFFTATFAEVRLVSSLVISRHKEISFKNHWVNKHVKRALLGRSRTQAQLKCVLVREPVLRILVALLCLLRH